MDTRVQPTPLQRRLAELGRTLALVAVALCAVVLVLGLARGEPLELMLVTAISLAVAAVPESLPAVVTFSLALGARRMVARNAVVRRLPAVETLGLGDRPGDRQDRHPDRGPDAGRGALDARALGRGVRTGICAPR